MTPKGRVTRYVRLTVTLVLAAALGTALFSLSPSIRSSAEGGRTPSRSAAHPLFSPGDWVEVATARDCVEVRLFWPDPSRGVPPAGLALSRVLDSAARGCLPNGFVGLIVEGPDEAEGRTWWALAGWGWVPAEALRFHHRGEPPYPHRPELAAVGRISFIGPDGNVWMMNGDGSSKRKLFPLDATRTDLVELWWSPDGAYFAVEDYRRHVTDTENGPRVVGSVTLHIASADGTPLLQLPTHGHSFKAWSSTSDTFAVFPSPQVGKKPGLIVFTLTGNVVLELPGTDNRIASFSADGRRLAFFQIVGPGGLWPDVQGLIADLHTGIVQPIDAKEKRAHGFPVWSPRDPALLAYGSRLINIDTGQEYLLPGSTGRWSPDGRFLLLAKDGQPRCRTLVYDVRAAASVFEFDIIDGGGEASCPERVGGRWSPDGRYLVYSKPDGGSPVLQANVWQVWDAPTGVLVTLTPFVWDSVTGQSKPITHHGTLVGFSHDNQQLCSPKATRRRGNRHPAHTNRRRIVWQPRPGHTALRILTVFACTM